MQVLPALANEFKGEFSLLGLGDVVVPGLFVALLLRYDAISARVDPRGCERRDFPQPHFFGNVVAYAGALGVTVAVMYVFDHGQPALLYLVPACLGAALLTGLLRGDLARLVAYDEESAHAALKAAAALKAEAAKEKSE